MRAPHFAAAEHSHEYRVIQETLPLSEDYFAFLDGFAHGAPPKRRKCARPRIIGADGAMSSMGLRHYVSGPGASRGSGDGRESLED